MSGESLRVEFRRQVRERVLDTAAALTVERGWDHVRIGEVAARPGVPADPRPPVRHQGRRRRGPRDPGGRAVLHRHRHRARTARDPPAGVRAAVRFTLDQAGGNPLLRAILTGSRSGDTSLLPFLTTRGDAIITGGNALVGDWLRRRRPELQRGQAPTTSTPSSA